MKGKQHKKAENEKKEQHQKHKNRRRSPWTDS